MGWLEGEPKRASLVGWLDAGHPPGGPLWADRHRIRLLSLFIATAGILALVFIPWALVQGRPENAALFGLGLCLLVGLRAGLVRGHQDLAAAGIALICTALPMAGLWTSGGPDSGAATWIPLQLVVFPLILRRPHAVVAVALHFVLLGVLVFADARGFRPPVVRAVGDNLVDLMGASIAMVALVSLFAANQRRHERELAEAVGLLEAEVERRRIAEVEALSAERLKATFLATMSHEIRTPMNGVIGMAEVLSESPLAADQREMLGTIQRSGEHLLRVINDTLDLSRIQAGGMTVRAEPFSPRACVQEVVALLQQDPRARDIQLHADISPQVPALLRGDVVRVRQMVLNLAGNALKFTERGGVRVRALWSSEAGFRVEVQDTGPGIATADLARIFQPFEQVEGGLRRRHGGTGLGLAIVEGLARTMRGTVGCESVLGRGSTFWFELPLPMEEAPQPEKPPTTSPCGVAPNLRVLVVEDNPVNTQVIGLMLGALGLPWDHAEHGQAAIEMIGTKKYRLVLMDCQMPVLDGFEATRRLRAQGVGLPIVAVTANAMPEDRQRCLDAGMNDYLPKPVQLSALREMVARWTDRVAVNG